MGVLYEWNDLPLGREEFFICFSRAKLSDLSHFGPTSINLLRIELHRSDAT